MSYHEVEQHLVAEGLVLVRTSSLAHALQALEPPG